MVGTRIVAVMGSKNSGKTTTVEFLIRRLSEDGYRVGAVKHIHHEFTLDEEGKDTWRMAKSGAEIVSSVSPNEVAILYKRIENWEENLEKVFTLLKDEGLDIVVAEGFHMVLGKRGDILKIVTVKNIEEAHQFINNVEQPVIAMVIKEENPLLTDEMRQRLGNLPVLSFPPDNSLYNILLQHL